MTHDVKNNEAAGRFEIELNGETAYAEYELDRDGGIVFPHTVVPESLGGKGIGSALVSAGLAHAKEQGLQVIPLCSFFAAYIKRHPEHREQVHPEYLDRVGG